MCSSKDTVQPDIKKERSQSATQEVLDRDNSQSDVEAVKCTARKARIMVWP